MQSFPDAGPTRDAAWEAMTSTAYTPCHRHRPLRIAALFAALVAALLAPLFAPAASAADDARYEPHARIADAATTFMTREARVAHAAARIEVTAGQLDPRLRMVRCDAPLETFMPPGGRTLGRTVAGVRCPTGARWSLFVPVHVAAYREVVTLARPLARGTRLAAGDLAVREHDLGDLPRGWIADPAQAVDRALRRAGGSGDVLTPALLSEPQVVRRGQRVRLESTAGTVGVHADAEALGHAARGERVRVRNLSSGEVVQAVAISDGVVATGPGAAQRSRQASSPAESGRNSEATP